MCICSLCVLEHSYPTSMDKRVLCTFMAIASASSSCEEPVVEEEPNKKMRWRQVERKTRWLQKKELPTVVEESTTHELAMLKEELAMVKDEILEMSIKDDSPPGSPLIFWDVFEAMRQRELLRERCIQELETAIDLIESAVYSL